jgi:MraZ protein
MLQLRGSQSTKLDGKGRIKLPVGFRSEIEQEQGNEFYVTSLKGDCIRLYPFAIWDEIEKKIAALPSKKPVVKKFLRATNYYGQRALMDSQGRLLLPQGLRESARLEDEVRVVGSMDYLEIWRDDTLKNAVESNPWTDSDDEELSEIGIAG